MVVSPGNKLGLRSLIQFSGLSGHGSGDVMFRDGEEIKANRGLNDPDNAPTLQSTNGTGFHNLNFIPDFGFIFLVVHCKTVLRLITL